MKKITRTITLYSGVEVKANFKTRTFEEKPFFVYDESDLPENAQDVKISETLYEVSVEDFLRVAKPVSGIAVKDK